MLNSELQRSLRAKAGYTSRWSGAARDGSGGVVVWLSKLGYDLQKCLHDVQQRYRLFFLAPLCVANHHAGQREMLQTGVLMSGASGPWISDVV